MNNRTRNILLIVLVVGVLGWGTCLSVGVWAFRDFSEFQGRQDASGPLVNETYRFRFDAPGGGWSLLSAEEIQAFNPDAIAGARNGTDLFAALIVERVGEMDLDAYAELLLNNLDAVVSEKKGPTETTFGGLPARRFEVKAAREGLSFTFLGFVTIREGWAYYLTAWTTDVGGASPPQLSKLPSLLRAFSFLEGPPRFEGAGAEVLETVGPGWQVQGATFEHVAGLRATTTEGWNMRTGEALDAFDDSALVGFQAIDGIGTLSVGVLTGVSEDETQPNIFPFAKPEKTDFALSLLGEDRPLARYDFPPQQVLATTACEGGRCIWVAFYFLATETAAAEARLSAPFPELSWLPDTEAQAIEAAQASTTWHRRVGEHWAFRRRTWRDFNRGFTLPLPQGSWDIDFSHGGNPEPPFVATEVRHDLVVALESWTANPDFALGDYVADYLDTVTHSAAVEGLGTRAHEAWGLGAAESPVRVLLVEHLGRILALTVEGADLEGETVRAKVQAVFANFSVQPKEDPFVQDGATIVDRRLGWRYRPPGEGWKVKQEFDEGVGGMGTRWSWDGPGHRAVNLVAIDPGAGAAQASQVEQTLVNAGFGKLDTLGKLETENIMWLEREARHFHAQVSVVTRLDGWSVNEGGTVYVIAVDSAGYSEPEGYKDGFRLLEGFEVGGTR